MKIGRTVPSIAEDRASLCDILLILNDYCLNERMELLHLLVCLQCVLFKLYFKIQNLLIVLSLNVHSLHFKLVSKLCLSLFHSELDLYLESELSKKRPYF